MKGSVAKLTVTAWRSFLDFLHLEGITERSLGSAVPTVLRRRLAGLPKGLAPGQVRQILAACDVGTVVGIRDLAILTWLVRLGLRRIKVAGLGLDDIDWRAGTNRVRGKVNCHERLPLPPDVGSRLAEYLRHARSADSVGRPCSFGILRPIMHLGHATSAASWRMQPGARVWGASTPIACVTPRQRRCSGPVSPCQKSARSCVIAAP